MTNYQISWKDTATKQLKKLGATAAKKLYNWVKNNLEGTSNPTAIGHYKQLTGNMSQYGRYRVGDYRIIVEIKQAEIVVEIIQIGHRSSIYRSSVMKYTLKQRVQGDYKKTEAVQEEHATVSHTVLANDTEVAPIKYDGPVFWSIEELKEQAKLRGIKIDV